jgi:hypothetical protein
MYIYPLASAIYAQAPTLTALKRLDLHVPKLSRDYLAKHVEHLRSALPTTILREKAGVTTTSQDYLAELRAVLCDVMMALAKACIIPGKTTARGQLFDAAVEKLIPIKVDYPRLEMEHLHAGGDGDGDGDTPAPAPAPPRDDTQDAIMALKHLRAASVLSGMHRRTTEDLRKALRAMIARADRSTLERVMAHMH